MDERTDPSAAFALRLSTDLVTALVLQGTMTKEAASTLIADVLTSLLESHPEHEEALREIAATMTAQIGLSSVMLWRKLEEK